VAKREMDGKQRDVWKRERRLAKREMGDKERDG
jgi:hypothetical protein